MDKKLRIFAAVLSALLLLSAAGCTKQAPVVQTELTFSPAATEPYAAELKREQSARLHATVGAAILQTKGEGIYNVWNKDSNALWLLYELASAFEARGIPAKDYTEIVQTLCTREDLLVLLLDGNRSAGERFAAVFGQIAAQVGVQKTALLGYDFSRLYCQYQAKKSEKNYLENPNFTYLWTEAQAWKERNAGLKQIGEENFASLLRFWLSGLTAFSAQAGEQPSASGFINALYAGEIALYLRTQGQVLSRLRMTKEDYAFTLVFFGEVFKVDACAAIAKAGKQTEYAAHLAGVTGGIAKALQSADDASATLLLDSPLRCAERLLGTLTEAEREPFAAMLAIENAEESYTQYIRERQLTAKFETYRTLERAGIEKSIFDSSPQLAFLVFGR